MALAYFVEIFLFFFYGGPRFFFNFGGRNKNGDIFFYYPAPAKRLFSLRACSIRLDSGDRVKS